jgi:predicted CXXCH cytochrome family protein
LQCHTDKSGPYLFEHGASRIEGCTACHEVHGSPNRHMLTQQSISDLCFSCHTHAVSWHSRFNSTSTNCTVCHSTIHGSNLSKIFLK